MGTQLIATKSYNDMAAVSHKLCETQCSCIARPSFTFTSHATESPTKKLYRCIVPGGEGDELVPNRATQ